jgi:uncharacterized protein (TIGR03089 family)
VPPPYDTPSSLLGALATGDPTRPRLTWYDDATGPTQGERIELSGRVLANWAAKAANLLQEDLDVGPGTVVELDLPVHWRAAYWLFAAWSVGAEVVTGCSLAGRRPDVVVTDDPEDWPGAAVVAVSLPALTRAWTGSALGAGVVDEARDLATYPDVFAPLARPGATDAAFVTPTHAWTYAELVPAAVAAAEASGLPAGARVMTSSGADQAVAAWLAPWSIDGSLVLVRPDPTSEAATLEPRAEAERITHRL